MFFKKPFVVESFVTIGLFDCDHTHMQCDTFNSRKVFHDVQVGLFLPLINWWNKQDFALVAFNNWEEMVRDLNNYSWQPLYSTISSGLLAKWM